ncbi:MAG TPA: hypothetical protein VFD17_02050 [Clostridia bacterium]|nr:hypothetical protein [Clostridia bacterium]
MNYIKEDAIKIIKNLPEEATWDDIIYQFYVKKKITDSLRVAEEGKILTHDDVKKRVMKK